MRYYIDEYKNILIRVKRRDNNGRVVFKHWKSGNLYSYCPKIVKTKVKEIDENVVKILYEK